MAAKFSRNQIITVIICSYVNFFCSVCISLQAPFYPAEAEAKNATATEYGFVIGSYELVGFMSSPFFGKINVLIFAVIIRHCTTAYMLLVLIVLLEITNYPQLLFGTAIWQSRVQDVGPKRMLSVGMMISSIAVIMFGFLDLIEGGTSFIIWSLVLRVIDSLGAAAATVSSFSLVSCVFSDNIATIMSTLETFVGFGYIVGPTLGGALYQLGGFPLPFVSIGILTAFVSILIIILVPSVSDKALKKDDTEGRIWQVLKVPSIRLDIICTIIFNMNVGFYDATLEPHLRVFNLTPVLVGLVFVVCAATYLFSSPLFGRWVDRGLNPKHGLIISCSLNIVGFMILGPFPYLPIPSSLPGIILALFIHGFALAAGNISTFIDATRSAVAHGFPEDFSTYGLISGMWVSSLSLGAFIGPSISGVFYDLGGFQNSILFLDFVNFILLLFLIWQLRDKTSYAKLVEIEEPTKLRIKSKIRLNIRNETKESSAVDNLPQSSRQTNSYGAL